LDDDVPGRVAEAERRAVAAEEAAREAADRAGRAEEAAEARVREATEASKPTAQAPEHYDDLAAEEVIALLPSLSPADLQMLLDYERRHAKRAGVIQAIESVLARGETPV
ncbi:MAG TPA: hypothetical protein VI122_13095, partial [Thermoleophilaceae bacterium]